MTRQETVELLKREEELRPIKEAFARGEDVEFRNESDSLWSKTKNPSWIEYVAYRIAKKKIKKTVDLEASDWKGLWKLMSREWNDGCYCMPTHISSGGISYDWSYIKFDRLKSEGWLRTQDEDKMGWLPCSKEVEVTE